MAKKRKDGTCPKCHGQMAEVTAQHLKDKRGEPLKYSACPGDCAGIARQDIHAGKVKR